MAGLSQKQDHYKSAFVVPNLSTSSEIGAQIYGQPAVRAVLCVWKSGVMQKADHSELY